MQAVAAGKLAETEVKWKDASACCVVMASKGYPTAYEKGFEITLPQLQEDEHVFVAGAKLKDDKLVTSGGRVLGAVTVKPTLKEAIDASYALVDRIHFDNAFYRRDIGQRALAAKEEK
jgi:phosphoribosylamine--glycine ligase